jgi:hypothetical protein
MRASARRSGASAAAMAASGASDNDASAHAATGVAKIG